MTEKPNLQILPIAVPEETMKEVLNPSANAVGQAFGGIFNWVLSPLIKLNIIKQKELEDFADKINRITEEIPQENRDDSKFGLALKAMEDARYQLNEKTMREMFASLISSTVDNRVNEGISPRFSEILKNMTTSEALLIKLLREHTRLPIVQLSLQSESGKTILLNRDVILLPDNSTIYDLKQDIDSIQATGLIMVERESELGASNYQNTYDNYKKTYRYTSVKSCLPDQYGDEIYSSIELKKGQIVLSEFGKIFAHIVLKNQD